MATCIQDVGALQCDDVSLSTALVAPGSQGLRAAGRGLTGTAGGYGQGCGVNGQYGLPT